MWTLARGDFCRGCVVTGVFVSRLELPLVSCKGSRGCDAVCDFGCFLEQTQNSLVGTRARVTNLVD
eukprot:4405417-Amphidinium_carterae.1